MLNESFRYIDEIMADTNKSSYDKAIVVGNTLSNIAADLVTSQQEDTRRSGANIINSFIDLAMETGDEQIRKYASRIAENAREKLM